MRKKISIIKTNNVNEDALLLYTEPSIALDHLRATGQMLVDSDGLSFIYLTENADEYTYISISDGVWNDLKKAMDLNMPVYVSNEKDTLELVNFLEELSYLIENIKGNSNYGEEMVAKVESIF
ncbi:hypothetical protein [Bacillus dakarensis]|uniref:UPF0738 family protein n=1 Tax=Robertmurraya dakarensis TaxID=1926278 RepID=UPI000981F2E1|nr:hypothetical protein [Bacillus dakarensis]